ncbi:tumor protein p53-inducible nuclear protein 2 [Xyrauchen texanus]|uniref:tumor protein p53-inducible nuclear protein 2 n=1 Tax=Xyrauchen texanus TaxID=154827 RepID=UPI002241F038|nr:tumor protein p53-inducible nuclear protein 2 [Xyrauchen texanus]
MFAKLIAQFVGSAEKDSDVAVETDDCANLLEFEDGDWVIIKINENQSLGSAEANILENLLIEHPSISVYQIPEEDLASDEVEDMARPVPLRRHVSWRLAAWGSPLPCSTILLSVQRARVYNEHRKMNRGALNRKNLIQTRFSPSDRRFGYFKQPTQRLYNY